MNNKKKPYSISLALTIYCLLFVISPLSVADDQNLAENEYEISVQSIALLHIRSADQFLYFLNDKLYSYLSHNSNEPDQQFDNLEDVPTNVPMVIYIHSQQVLQSLTTLDRQALKDFYESSFFIGIGSAGGQLKSVLEVEPGSDYDSVEEEFTNELFFIHKKTDGSINELILHNIQANPGALNHFMSWRNNLYPATPESRVSAQPSGAWDASYTMDRRVKLSGGTTRLLVNGFKLKSPQDKPDYYLVTTSMQTDITSHACDSLKGHCGWYSNEMFLSAKVDTANQGKLYEYMPTGSVGSSTTGFSIGGTLTTTQAGVSVGYSQSYSISDATYIDNSDYITNTAEWTIKFTKPNYIWFPFIVDAPNVARNSYETQPAFIVEVLKGQCAKMFLKPYTLQQNDTFKYFVFVLKVTEHLSDWYSKSTALPQTVICGTS